MAIVKGMDKLMSLDVRGRIGYSSGFGRMVCGIVQFGYFDNVSGVYQHRHTLQGRQVVKMRFSAASNPRTPAQQAWRAVFSAGRAVYSTLTSEQKHILSIEARKYQLSGQTLFMRRYLQSHRS